MFSSTFAVSFGVSRRSSFDRPEILEADGEGLTMHSAQSKAAKAMLYMLVPDVRSTFPTSLLLCMNGLDNQQPLCFVVPWACLVLKLTAVRRALCHVM